MHILFITWGSFTLLCILVVVNHFISFMFCVCVGKLKFCTTCSLNSLSVHFQLIDLTSRYNLLATRLF